MSTSSNQFGVCVTGQLSNFIETAAFYFVSKWHLQLILIACVQCNVSCGLAFIMNCSATSVDTLNEGLKLLILAEFVNPVNATVIVLLI